MNIGKTQQIDYAQFLTLRCLLFGLPDTQLESIYSKRFLCILTFCARKNILLKYYTANRQQ